MNSGDLNLKPFSKKQTLKRSETMKDQRSAMDKFIDKFWLLNVTRYEASEERILKVAELDAIHAARRPPEIRVYDSVGKR